MLSHNKIIVIMSKVLLEKKKLLLVVTCFQENTLCVLQKKVGIPATLWIRCRQMYENNINSVISGRLAGSKYTDICTEQ